MILLIHPPVTKPCEPPGGIGKLYGALKTHGVNCRVLDANLEGLLYGLDLPKVHSDTWGTRASHSLLSHLSLLKSRQGYHSVDRYKRAVLDLNHLLESNARLPGVYCSLADYKDEGLSPVKSSDLMRSAERPESNPFYPYFRHRLLELLEKDGPSVVGVSLTYLSQALCAFSMIGYLRRKSPGIKIILGGGLISSWVKRPDWQNPFKGLVDEIIAGPGEGPLLSMMGVDERRFKDHYTPDYEPFLFKDYLAPGPILPYGTSTGCYWNKCSFCPERTEGNPYFPIPPKKVILDLQALVEQVRPVLIHLLDNAIPPSLMKGIADCPPGAPWYGFVRLTRHFADLDFCMALKRSGCVLLKLGIESGDQHVLDALHKGIHLEETSQVLKNLKTSGIATYVYLLFGTPEEGLSEARKTLEFVVRHREDIHFLNLALFNLPVGNQETPTMERRSFYEGDLSLYVDFDHPTGWQRKQVRQFLDKEFKRHPAIAPILRRTPPLFTSNHAPFFIMGKKRT